MRVPKIALTGGPCGGKSSGLSYLEKHFSSLGYKVYVVPEAATLSILGGASGAYNGGKQFQKELVKLVLALEDHFENHARTSGSRPAILICDRGACDGKAFCTKEEWQEALAELGTSEEELAQRYQIVIHLITAAEGAEEFYTLENNAARKETPEEARVSDKRLREAWLGSKLKIIDNSTDFARKIERVGEAVAEALGVPAPIETEKKWVIPRKDAEKLADLTLPGPERRVLAITQTYLLSPNGESRRVRKRSQAGSVTFYHTTKKPLGPGKCVEYERIISQAEYEALLTQADPSRKTIRKDRIYFIENHHQHEVDLYHEPNLEFATLEIETKDPNVQPPSFLADSAQDVTGDERYLNKTLAEENPQLP